MPTCTHRLRAIGLALLCVGSFATAGCAGGESATNGDGGLLADAANTDAANTDAANTDASPTTDAANAPSYDAHGEALLLLQFGDNLAPAVRARVETLLRRAESRRRVEVAPSDARPENLGPGSLVLSFGRTATGAALIPAGDLAAEGSEGFVVRSGTLGGAAAIASDGNVPAPDPLHQASLGAAYGAYALLEELGFAFLHPLAPTVPAALPDAPATVALHEHPRWPVRGWHLHTMHPTELTEMLNGWGPGGTNDRAGWESTLPEWDSFLEWMLANRQNRVEWFLLWAQSWGEFGDSAERQARLRRLVDVAHSYGIAVGVDVPVALEQQHAYRLVRTRGTADEDAAQIRARVDWLMAAGFDFLGTENGTSEYTHPSPDQMLGWMNTFAAHLRDAYGKQGFVKIHCSTGQTADGYPDPDTGMPINYNFLPHFADPSLGVMPHTVQDYAFDDPAPTYGNQDFEYMRAFLQQEAGARDVVWHPETAYWVSYDVDVPLFLPLYAERRVYDLRLLGQDEIAGRMGRGPHAGARMSGQMVFSSGWEWGYWLNDVIAARSAWDPHLEVPDSAAAFRAALRPLTRALGPAGEGVADVLVETAAVERALFTQGSVNGVAPQDPTRRNGQAYLEGWEAWDDVAQAAAAFGVHMSHQPARLGLLEMRVPGHPAPRYTGEVEPLLGEMESELTRLADAMAAQSGAVPERARPLFDDLADAARITALRAQQVHGLYDYVDQQGWDGDRALGLTRLQSARGALDEAAQIVARREANYRVPVARIAGWRNNPTSYEFAYLWTVHSLYYWWRDEGLAVDHPLNPCYLNIINPADVAMGEGIETDGSRVARDLFSRNPSLGSAAECLAESRAEPTFPQSGLRTRQ